MGDWELKAINSIHLNRKAAIVFIVASAQFGYLLIRLIRSVTAVLTPSVAFFSAPQWHCTLTVLNLHGQLNDARPGYL